MNKINKKYNRSRKTRRHRKSRRTHRNRKTIHRQRGGAGCAGEYALVQGIKIPEATSVDSSFSGLSIDNAMSKIYDPKCATLPTDVPGPIYKM